MSTPQIIFNFVITAIFGYLTGSINLSMIITKHVGKFDITKRGSGNAGGTNVARTMGAKWGIITISLEIIKTILAGVIAGYLFPATLAGIFGNEEMRYTALYTMSFCFLGNVYPVFHKFKGGKGVSAFAAVALFFDWKIFLIGAAIFFIILFTTGIVSVGSMLGSLIVPVLYYIFNFNDPNHWFPLCLLSSMALLLILKHIPNIKRLIKGTENRFTFKKKDKKE